MGTFENQAIVGNEELVLACECGSTVKASALNEKELETLVKWFCAWHMGDNHQQVTCRQAADIRAKTRERSKRAISK